MKLYKKLKRGIIAGIKQSIGLNLDATIHIVQVGQVIGCFICFIIKWAIISIIFILTSELFYKYLPW